MRSFFNTIVGVCAVVFTVCEAKVDRHEPHDHKGKLTPYSPGPFSNLQLTSQDEAQLAQGKPVLKQIERDSGSAICVQDISAPKVAVWNQILDFGLYTEKVNTILYSSNYHVDISNDEVKKIKTKMVLGILPGYSYELFYEHTFYPQQDSLTWTLDYSKRSDMDDISGQWYLEERESGLETRVFFACDISLRESVPKSILHAIARASLKSGTNWVKRQSEQNAEGFQLAEQYGYKHKVSSAT